MVGIELSKSLRRVALFAWAGIKARFRGSWAGFAWVSSGPLLILTVQALTFSLLFRMSYWTFLTFLLSGLIPWLYFSQTLEMSTGILTFQSKLWKGYQQNPLELIAAQAGENLLAFAPAFFLAYVLGLCNSPMLLFWRLPYFLVGMTAFTISTIALGFFLSLLQIRFYDTRFVLSPTLNILFYLTPILYPKEFLPESWHWLVNLNPLTLLLEPLRRSMLIQSTLDVADFAIAFFISCALLSLAILFWERSRVGLINRL